MKRPKITNCSHVTEIDRRIMAARARIAIREAERAALRLAPLEPYEEPTAEEKEEYWQTFLTKR